MTSDITPIVMPKWGLAMQEGELVTWLVDHGSSVEQGTEIAEIETTKLSNAFEAPVAGHLHHVAKPGETLPVGALIAVAAKADTDSSAITAFVEDFQSNFVPEENDEDSGSEPKKISVDGLDLSYLETGQNDGESILLIHGFGADSDGWMFNQSALSETIHTIAVDLPGHGNSSKTVGDGTLHSLAATIGKMLDGLSLQRVHLVGHSLGGGIALALAEHESVASLTLIAPAGVGDEVNGDFLEGFLTAKRRKALQPILELLVDNPELIGRDMVEDVLKLKRLDGVQDALNKLVEANFDGNSQRHDLKAKLSIKPTQIIWGENDAIIPSNQTKALVEGPTIQVIADAGHVPQMEQSAAVNDAILKHIKELNQ